MHIKASQVILKPAWGHVYFLFSKSPNPDAVFSLERGYTGTHTPHTIIYEMIDYRLNT